MQFTEKYIFLKIRQVLRVKKNSINNKKSVIRRLFKNIFEFYPVMFPVVIVCILFNATISSIPAVFMQNVIALIEKSWQSGNWNAVGGKILNFVSILVVFYTLSILSGIAYNQMMAIITQGTLKKFCAKCLAECKYFLLSMWILTTMVIS